MTKPNNLVVDVCSSHAPGMTYVMLSRCCSMQQLHILEQLDPVKISVDEKVREEAARMLAVSLNANPCEWMDPAKVGLRVCSLNCRSLRKHIGDVRTDPVLLQADIICLQETWLEDGEGEKGDYQLEGYRAFFNSVGPGKGVAVFIKEGLRRVGAHKFTDANIQLAKIERRELEIINIYRSQHEPLPSAACHLRSLIDPGKDTLVIGDFNVCATKANPLRNFLEDEGFRQLVTLPTHIQGGILLDFVNFALAMITSCQEFLIMLTCGGEAREGRDQLLSSLTPHIIQTMMW